MTFRARRAESDAEREEALAVRREVFVEEQGVPEELEVDGRDDEAIHFVAYTDLSGDDADSDSGSRVVGTVRLRDLGDVGKVERMAVRRDYRGEGLGQKLMAAVESTAEENGFSSLRMHAQKPVEGFYRMLGYETTSEPFEEAGISHVEMEKSLD